MASKIQGLIIVLIALSVNVFAQQKKFALPTGADYARGKVLVKVKPEFKDGMIADPTGRQAFLPVIGIRPLVKPALVKRNLAARGPVAAPPAVDIARYFEVTYDASKDIETYINELYRTGYFELIEPSYVYQPTFTPNDPRLSNQYFLNTIKAIEAWDITQGDAGITIAIVDTGGDLNHPDLAGKLYVNTKEIANNGIDDDADGYVDNVSGWDFVGADTLNITKNLKGDNNPQIVVGGEISHGTWVAGCAGANTNNNIGVAGVGFKTTLMFTKHTADNQKSTVGSIYFGYDGILYAANQGIKIINCSWGGPGGGQIFQDIINHVTFDLGCLVVAAAGNSGDATPSYPAAYDNVLSVAATTSTEKAAVFTTFGPTIDIAAPGAGIYTTSFDDTYRSIDGTSFSSPITAGAAALVWAKFPGFSPLQVAEQLRVTSDASALYGANPTMKNLLGHGRLDIQKALTAISPSIRATNAKLLNTAGSPAQPGQSAFLTFDFTNFLAATSSGFQVTLSAPNTWLQIKKSVITPGVVQTNETINNSLVPFELVLSPSVPENTVITFVLTFTDGSYTDTQPVPVVINPSYIDVNSNKVSSTVTEIGRLGYQDPSTGSQGLGFVFDQQQILSEMGLIMGTSTGNLFNNVRGVSKYDLDFTSVSKIHQDLPGKQSDAEISGAFSNIALVTQQNFLVNYRSMVWRDAPRERFFIIEYKIKNTGAAKVDGFYFGMFADFDITDQGQFDAADWYAPQKLGYIYPAKPSAKPYAGIQLLTTSPSYYAIDNNPTPGVSLAINDGYTTAEKMTTISTQRLTAGMSTADGSDVSHVVSSGPWSIDAGTTITIAFAVHAGSNLDDLKTSAAYADTTYNYTLQAPRPLVDTATACYNSPASLIASGAAKYKWYKTPTGGTAFFTGSQFNTGPLTSDTVFYVANADQSYESVRTPAVVRLKANPKILTSGSTTICQGQSLTLSVDPADGYLWSTSQTTQTIVVNTSGSYTVTVTDNALHCSSISDPVMVTVNPIPVAAFGYTGDLVENHEIMFHDMSTDAQSWFWAFGDESTSVDQNPVHSFAGVSNFSVSLTVTNSLGCQATTIKHLGVVTGLEDPSGIAVYPNPVHGTSLVVQIIQVPETAVNITLTNLLGETILTSSAVTGNLPLRIEIGTGGIPEGVFLLRVRAGDRLVVKKITNQH